jgi:dethiobiotin synthetase
MRTKTFFVTGTDTEVGKTFISQALLFAMGASGLSTTAYKPVAAGCEQTSLGLRNEDALLLQSASNIELSYDEVNPIAFAEPVAPHLAAQNLSQTISLKAIHDGFIHLQQKQGDVLLVEGAGGWRLPLGADPQGEQRYLSDFAIQHKLPVIMVVGIRLGCLNHALLTAEAIRSDGLELVGWVANQIDSNMAYRDENIQSLKEQLNAPFIGTVPKLEDPEQAIKFLDLRSLLRS